jgi:hypothetical protein
MFYFFLIVVAAAAVAVYVLFFVSQVPGATEERFGVLEALPENLGRWTPDDDSPEGKAALAEGRKREVRVLHEASHGLLGGEYLVRQVRYRSAETNAIEHVEPEQRVRRRRVKV